MPTPEQIAHRALVRARNEAHLQREQGRTLSGHMGNLSEQNLNQNAQYDRDWFSYPFNIGTIAATGVVNQTIQIQADSAFDLMQITAQGNLNGASEPWPSNVILPFTIMLTDTGTGRNLMNTPVPINMIAGRGELPFILPQNRIFAPKATIQIQCTGYGGGTYNNIFVNLIGAKLFAYG